MFRLRTVAVVVLLAASSLLTLRLMGLSQWIQAILVIAVELSLGVVLHEMVDGHARRERATSRHLRPGHHPALPTHRRRPPHGHAPAAYEPRCRLLLPVHEDRPDLVDYALRECRSHRAELDLLVLRPPGDVEGGRAIIERLRRRAEHAGVPFRADSAVTKDAPATILERATAGAAALVVMAAPRGGRFAGTSMRDEIRAVLDALPEHVGLLVHA
jgi:nucleotide-binding universal stress UspA family protein